MPLIEARYVVFRGQTIELRRDSVTGFWKSADGTIWAYAENSDSVDSVDRCGIGFFSLPPDNPLTDACKYHDYAYSSRAYQAFYSRSEADQRLRMMIAANPTGWRIFAAPFYWITRKIGSRFWENKKTND